MTQVAIEQEALDAFATDINGSVDAVAAEIQKLVDDPGNPLVAADVTALTAAVDKLKALEPPAVEPVPDEPHPDQTLPGDL
jgi:DNA polymerase III delta subunit